MNSEKNRSSAPIHTFRPNRLPKENSAVDMEWGGELTGGPARGGSEPDEPVSNRGSHSTVLSVRNQPPRWYQGEYFCATSPCHYAEKPRKRVAIFSSFHRVYVVIKMRHGDLFLAKCRRLNGLF
ncbi:hypothetical protein HNY73_015351 [Argiope bruennichi]|uniref:Uncharacterized protein n=1 Tax=Argiope bruennichi TaxID=94029 RepID=A0A8T0ET77_ARGBR|nr:hypothetical protein HNY73_015351 [Argiope bruennichi]